MNLGKEEDLMRFKVARNEARKSIREAKNSWFRAKAQEEEGEHFGERRCGSAIEISSLEEVASSH